MSSKPSSAAESVSAVPPDAGFTDAGAIEAEADPRPAVAADPSSMVTTDAPMLDANGYDPAHYDWVPVLRKPRTDGWSPQRQRAFIGTLADCGSVRRAAEQVNMSPSSAYTLRRSAGGAAFAAAWDAAMQQAAHVLVDEAFERGLNGADEPVFDRDGVRVGMRHRRSDALMIFLLRKHFPDRYGDLHRDRSASSPASALPAPPVLPAVAAALPALGPVEPADPLALMAPDDAAEAIECADILDGRLARWHVQDGSDEVARGGAAPAVDSGLDARLEEARRAADPRAWAAVDALHAASDAVMKGGEAGARGGGAKRR